MKYDAMIEKNKIVSEQKVHIAKETIENLAESGEKITVVELVRRTGLSRGFFYKNEEVRREMDRAIQRQGASYFSKKNSQKEPLEEDFRAEIKRLQLLNERLCTQNKTLVNENEELLEELKRLKKQLERKELAMLKNL